VLNWLHGRGSKPTELGEIDGRVDLRGIPLTSSPVIFGDKNDPRAGVTWSGLDLRRAQVDGLRFFAGRIENCLMDSASLRDLRLWGSEVNESSIRRATVYGALGTGEWLGRRNVWRQVAFDGAKLKDSAFSGCVLERCSFGNNGKRLVLEDCEVIDCTFRGEFTALLISGRGHRWPIDPQAFSADFSQATFTDSHVVGYALDRSRLPDQQDLILVRDYPNVIGRAVQWLADHTLGSAENSARDLLAMWTAPPGMDHTDLCFDLRGIDTSIAQAVRNALAQPRQQGVPE